MQNPDNDFFESINEGAKEESGPRKGSFPRTVSETNSTNYEILPIEELRKQGERLGVKNFENLNKQQLIEQIKTIKNQAG